MEEYSTLVSRILKNNVLLTEIETMMSIESVCHPKPATLNLITTDWMTCLEKNTCFQDCQFQPERKLNSTSLYGYETSKNILFNVILVGYCRFAKPYSGKEEEAPPIIISNCAPLTKIAKVMTRDLGSHLQISDEFKFNPNNTCTVSSCTQCKESAISLAKRGYHIKNDYLEPCIGVTKIFDGKEILNRFQYHMLTMISRTFLGIMHISINARYHYTDVSNPNQKLYRIGGTFNSLVAFNEAQLDLIRPINLGDLKEMEFIKETPSEKKKQKKNEVKAIENEDISLHEMFDSTQTQTNLTIEEEENEFKALMEQDKSSDYEDDPFVTVDDISETKRERTEDFFGIPNESKVKKIKCEESFLSME